MSPYCRKGAAIFVLFSIVFFAGYCFAESSGAVYDAYERSTRGCEHAVSSMGQAIGTDDRALEATALSHLVKNKNKNSQDILIATCIARLPGFKTESSAPGMNVFLRIPLSRPPCVLKSLRL